MPKFVTFCLCCLFLSLGLFAAQPQYGLNTHNFPCTNSAASKNFFEQLDLKWIRGGMPWWEIERVEGSPDPFDFQFVDQVFQYAQENGINILYVLSANPSFYGKSDHSYLYSGYESKWGAFVTAMVERYDGDGYQDMPGTDYSKPFIKHWELWNEPNLNTFWNSGDENLDKSTFVQRILIPGIAAVRAADPTAKICGPNLSNLGYDHGEDDPRHPSAWLSYITDQIGVVFDILAHHPYEDNASKVASSLKTFRDKAVAKGYSGVDVWATEVGWEMTESNIVDWMQDIFSSMAGYSGWWKKTFWYAWTSAGDNMGMFIAANDNICDPSDPFNLYYTFKNYTNPPSLAVTSPNGGESWYRGTTKTITWASSGIADVKIELVKGTTTAQTIAPSVDAPDHSYSWPIPSKLAVGNDYRIRISAMDPGGYGNSVDLSDAYFSIKEPGTSLIENGGFESNWTGWPDRSGVYAISTAAYAGSKACKLTGYSYGGNLITNGGFESSWTGWPTRTGNYSLSTTCRSGSYSCKLTGQAAAESGVASSAYAVQGGSAYKLTSYVLYQSGTGNYKVTIAWLNSSGGVIRYDNDWKGTNKPTAFTYHGGTFTAPAAAVTAKILLGVSANTAFLFDDVALQLYQTLDSSVLTSVYTAEAGKAYKLNSYVRYLSGSGNYKVTIAWLNSANNVIRYDNDWKGTNRPATYTYHGGTFTSPANTAKVRIILGVAPGTEYLFDAIELIPQ